MSRNPPVRRLINSWKIPIKEKLHMQQPCNQMSKSNLWRGRAGAQEPRKNAVKIRYTLRRGKIMFSLLNFFENKIIIYIIIISNSISFYFICGEIIVCGLWFNLDLAPARFGVKKPLLGALCGTAERISRNPPARYWPPVAFIYWPPDIIVGRYMSAKSWTKASGKNTQNIASAKVPYRFRLNLVDDIHSNSIWIWGNNEKKWRGKIANLPAQPGGSCRSSIDQTCRSRPPIVACWMNENDMTIKKEENFRLTNINTNIW